LKLTCNHTLVVYLQPNNDITLEELCSNETHS